MVPATPVVPEFFAGSHTLSSPPLALLLCGDTARGDTVRGDTARGDTARGDMVSFLFSLCSSLSLPLSSFLLLWRFCFVVPRRFALDLSQNLSYFLELSQA